MREPLTGLDLDHPIHPEPMSESQGDRIVVAMVVVFFMVVAALFGGA